MNNVDIFRTFRDLREAGLFLSRIPSWRVLRGVKIFAKILKGATISAKNLRGMKIFLNFPLFPHGGGQEIILGNVWWGGWGSEMSILGFSDFFLEFPPQIFALFLLHLAF